MELSRYEIDGKFSGISSVQELFSKQTTQTPDAVAVEYGNKKITYAGLSALATKLAQSIQNASPDSKIVGVSTFRSIDMLAAVLAVLQSGKAYLPLDPALPVDRLQQVMADSGIDCVVCPAAESAAFEALKVRTVAHDDITARAERLSAKKQGSLAYVLYTSGSTGKPKGVCMGHAALINLLHWQEKRSAAGAGTRTLQYAPLSFDVSFQEIFSTLGTGGTLVLIDDDLRLDPAQLLAFIRDQSVERIFVPFVALQYLTEAAAAGTMYPASLREVITAGEQLKITAQVAGFFSALPACSLDNQYGPTECHVVTANLLTGDPKGWPALPSIGKAIDQVSIHIIGADEKELPDGETGELCIAGVCVAEGYLNRPELTAEKFVAWTNAAGENNRIYRTGDLARVEPDGDIEFLGRRDDQVKIRGYRIEPGEIEVLLTAQPGIRQAVVVATEDSPGQLRLVAYLVPSADQKDTAAIRLAVSTHLPEYMMPSAFVWMENLPKTSSGKVDRKALPKPDHKRPDLSVLYTAPSTPMEKILASVWIPLLQYDKVGIHDNFFELGGNSLLAVKTVATLQLTHKLSLPVTKLYQHPTIAGIAALLEGRKTGSSTRAPKKQRRENQNEEVAIIAMAGRFPGTGTIPELWQMLETGKETISFFTRGELDPSIPQEIAEDPDYVRARGILRDPAAFDAAFFGVNPKLAELMDPQQRIFLEIAWEALEKAGYLPVHYNGTVGVFAGVGNNSYYLNNVLSNRVLVERMGAFQVMTYNEKDYIASRTAYTLDLKGPAVSVHSACSTSLLAIAEAVESLRSGQCEIALAGGASITAPIKSGHIYQEGAMLSKDGHCRSFDAQGDGTVFSDGAGVVLLKMREAAERDGDRILALVKGVGVNNDGGGKGSFSAPSAEGQAGAIRMALEDARVDPSTLSYIEAHGTATPLGDPIEIEGLRLAFGEQTRKQFCAIGSIKSNMGHLTAAAGVAGLIKTVLAMQHRQIPASLHYKKPNKDIDFANSPFFVNTALRPWDSNEVRRAGISSFGVGGTNVHVVLEEYQAPVAVSGVSRPVQLISWSAKTNASRDRYTAKLVDFVKDGDPSMTDLAYSLQLTRADFKSRRFVIAGSNDELREKLSAPTIPLTEAKTLDEGAGEIVFVFPGQGAQFVHMGLALYQHEPVFRQAVDECAALLNPLLGEDIRAVIYPENPDAAATEKLNDTFYTQPSLFVIGYALARLWMSWGVQPAAFIGHSIGEFVAAHLSGIFSLEDGLKLIAARGRLMQSLPRGTMLSVRAPYADIEPLLPNGISLAAINSPALCVVAGETDKVNAFAQALDASGIANKALHTSHAFHSEMMDPVVQPFLELVKTVGLQVPHIPVISTVTGLWLTDTNATDPAYWAQHLRSTVRFSQAAAFAVAQSYKIYLEAGPGTVSTVLIRQQPGTKGIQAIASLDATAGPTAYHAVLRALGQLWLQGVGIDWTAFYRGQQRVKIDLPSYAFEKTRFWVDPVNWVAPVVKEQANIINNSKPIETIQMRTDTLITKIKEILENASGIEMDQVTPDMGFIEMGLDSLLLTQVTLNIKKEFGVPVTFRQLNEDYSTLETLAGYLDKQLPADRYSAGAATTFIPAANPVATAQAPANGSAMSLISQQIQLLAQQVAMLQGGSIPQSAGSPVAATVTKPMLSTEGVSAEELAELKKPFGATARIERQVTELTPTQKAFLDDLTARYNKKTAGSKAYTAKAPGLYGGSPGCFRFQATDQRDRVSHRGEPLLG